MRIPKLQRELGVLELLVIAASLVVAAALLS